MTYKEPAANWVRFVIFIFVKTREMGCYRIGGYGVRHRQHVAFGYDTFVNVNVVHWLGGNLGRSDGPCATRTQLGAQQLTRGGEFSRACETSSRGDAVSLFQVQKHVIGASELPVEPHFVSENVVGGFVLGDEALM
ncbi:MAG: hypothetical protein AB1644_02870 [Candidatus Zixiibacteriota bacterium]